MRFKQRRSVKRNALLFLLLLICMNMTAPAHAATKHVTLTAGQRKQLSFKKSRKKVRWKSSKPGIASVSSRGKVTAKKAGKTVITAKSGKKKQKFLVTVKKSRIKVIIGGKSFWVDMENNRTARAFMHLLPMTLQMEELNGNEKYCYMDQTLPTKTKKPGTIRAGDLMLYGDDCVVLFYKSFRSGYSYTKIGHIGNVKGLQAALGNGKRHTAGKADLAQGRGDPISMSIPL